VAGKDKAVELAAKAAAAGGSKAWELVKRGAGNKAVKTAATKAGEGAAVAAAAGATTGGGTYLRRRRANRKHRRLAMDLARQIGGEVSVRTVIAGDRYYVVWRGDKPVDTFPALPKTVGPLNERPELIGFVGRRVTPPPD
jgi:hypothetical protein